MGAQALPHHLALSLAVLFTLSHASKCPCADERLCQPITTPPRKEVYAFSYATPQGIWKGFDWDQVTTVAWNNDPELMCYAHSRGVRVAIRAFFDVKMLTNTTYTDEWVTGLLQTAKDGFADGVNVDIEESIPASRPDLSKLLTALLQQLTNTFHREIPGSQVVFDAPYTPAGFGNRFYDFVGLANATDFLFLMFYDMRSAIWGPCLASANSPYQLSEHGINQYLALGIPASKLAFGVAWYGYDYPCQNTNDPKVQFCELKEVAWGGSNCSDSAGVELPYSTIETLLAQNSTTGRIWDPLLLSPHFNYVNSDDGMVHQMWYSDVQSLTSRYALAARYGLRGIGMWNANKLDYGTAPNFGPTPSSAAMWGAMKVFTGRTGES